MSGEGQSTGPWSREGTVYVLGRDNLNVLGKNNLSARGGTVYVPGEGKSTDTYWLILFP